MGDQAIIIVTINNDNNNDDNLMITAATTWTSYQWSRASQCPGNGTGTRATSTPTRSPFYHCHYNHHCHLLPGHPRLHGDLPLAAVQVGVMPVLAAVFLTPPGPGSCICWTSARARPAPTSAWAGAGGPGPCCSTSRWPPSGEPWRGSSDPSTCPGHRWPTHNIVQLAVTILV